MNIIYTNGKDSTHTHVTNQANQALDDLFYTVFKTRFLDDMRIILDCN